MADDVEIVGLQGVAVSYAAAQDLAAALDALEQLARERGACLSSRLRGLRRELLRHTGTHASTFAGVSATEVGDAAPTLDLDPGVTDVKTAAKALGLTEAGVRWRCRKGLLQATLRAGRWWIPADQLGRE